MAKFIIILWLPKFKYTYRTMLEFNAKVSFIKTNVWRQALVLDKIMNNLQHELISFNWITYLRFKQLLCCFVKRNMLSKTGVAPRKNVLNFTFLNKRSSIQNLIIESLLYIMESFKREDVYAWSTTMTQSSSHNLIKISLKSYSL